MFRKVASYLIALLFWYCPKLTGEAENLAGYWWYKEQENRGGWDQFEEWEDEPLDDLPEDEIDLTPCESDEEPDCYLCPDTDCALHPRFTGSSAPQDGDLGDIPT